jgi:predicted nucleic acid-binding protein
LPVLFQRVVAPPAVVAELIHTDAPHKVRQWAGSPPSWLEIESPTAVDRSLPLGAGEIEAISLAQELVADAVLIVNARPP